MNCDGICKLAGQPGESRTALCIRGRRIPHSNAHSPLPAPREGGAQSEGEEPRVRGRGAQSEGREPRVRGRPGGGGALGEGRGGGERSQGDQTKG